MNIPTDHVITIRAAAGGLFETVVKPSPIWAPFDRHDLKSYRAARRAAECIKAVKPSWPIRDEVPAELKEVPDGAQS